ncbi:lon protease [Anaeramoeba flamelloides]|uniref:Lon protease homolog n=1 Tax=Anaeramoeba flamelloides TaxID=1746091 RepID=A0ABQ8Y5C1_9EUKA|nr:lon protease [Anaeramoeba flamelloides]
MSYRQYFSISALNPMGLLRKNKNADLNDLDNIKIPKELPIIPLFGRPIFPSSVSTVLITPESLGNYFKKNKLQKNTQVGLFLTQKKFLDLYEEDVFNADPNFSDQKAKEDLQKQKQKGKEEKKSKKNGFGLGNGMDDFQMFKKIFDEDDSTFSNTKSGEEYNMSRIQELNQIHQVGVYGKIIDSYKAPINEKTEQYLVVSGLKRIHAKSCEWKGDHLSAQVEEYTTAKYDPYDEEIRGYTLNIIETINKFLELKPMAMPRLSLALNNYRFYTPNSICNLIGVMVTSRREELQEILNEQNILRRLEKCLTLSLTELEYNEIQLKINKILRDKIQELQRKYFLQQQLTILRDELGMKSDSTKIVKVKFEKILKDPKNHFPKHVTEAIQDQLTRLEYLSSSSAEFNNIRNYLDWITCLPWNKYRKENLDIPYARKILEEDHFGLKEIKKSILEFIAVGNLKKKFSGKILCLVGAPGVGKTSIGKSIARALNREYFRYSLGGLTDVSQLKGFKRTYVGALPGIFIQALKKLKTSNPVIVLDEVDKMGKTYKGDPASALLEALDPEQNSEFMDHFLDLPFDLSKVLFVMTANVIETIPRPLLDRMEILRISGYVQEEKIQIAKHYLIPRAMVESGLNENQAEITEEALNILIKDYCREEGVRNLKKHIEKIFRKVAFEIADNSNDGSQKLDNTNSNSNGNKSIKKNHDFKKIIVDQNNLSKFVGKPIFLEERIFKKPTVGVVTGLAWSAYGGSLLFIESVKSEYDDYFEIIESESDLILQNNTHNETNDHNIIIKPEDEESTDEGLTISNEKTKINKETFKKKTRKKRGHLKITGQLGNVMKESSQIAYSFAKKFLRKLKPNNDFLEVSRIHTHCPEGSIKKDGPSAGVTMVTSLISLALNKPIKENLAMTGEITLTGKILPVGGIKEKILAARRSGITQLIFPKENQRDWDELENYITKGLTAYFVPNYSELYKIAFPIEK